MNKAKKLVLVSGGFVIAGAVGSAGAADFDVSTITSAIASAMVGAAAVASAALTLVVSIKMYKYVKGAL
jgi:hypothetical protein